MLRWAQVETAARPEAWALVRERIPNLKPHNRAAESHPHCSAIAFAIPSKVRDRFFHLSGPGGQK